MTDEELQQAKQLIEQERQQREEQCRVALGEVLERYKCTLVVQAQNVDALTLRLLPTVRAL